MCCGLNACSSGCLRSLVPKRQWLSAESDTLSYFNTNRHAHAHACTRTHARLACVVPRTYVCKRVRAPLGAQRFCGLNVEGEAAGRRVVVAAISVCVMFLKQLCRHFRICVCMCV
jgi:hypothetical protein